MKSVFIVSIIAGLLAGCSLFEDSGEFTVEAESSYIVLTNGLSRPVDYELYKSGLQHFVDYSLGANSVRPGGQVRVRYTSVLGYSTDTDEVSVVWSIGGKPSTEWKTTSVQLAR